MSEKKVASLAIIKRGNMYPLSEQELVRIQKKEALEAMGIEPYPASSSPINAKAADILAHYQEENRANYTNRVLAGRVMGRRIMGAASFVELEDESGRIQLYMQRDSICLASDTSNYDVVFKKLLDLGDIIEVTGFVFTTKVGAIALHVTHFRLLSKALTPLPVVKEVTEQAGKKTYDAFTDLEQRYRQRYVDLIVNPSVRKVFQQRAQLIHTLRMAFHKQGYLEVETPILQPIYGGASARPFVTHHHTLDMPMYLRISNELYLKRLIVGGYDGVYEFSKDFRNEGMSRFHNPEFTQVELYVAYKDYYWMMACTETWIGEVAEALHGSTVLPFGPHFIDFKRPWQRFTLFEVIHHFTGYDIAAMDELSLRNLAHTLGITLEEGMGEGKIIDKIFSEKCEPNLIQPTFITDYPVAMSPLAKRHRTNSALTERFEVICAGKEICNAFSELNDPMDQQLRFEQQRALGEQGDAEAMVVDHDFLRALRYGMPPTVGIGIGIDRLTMIMTNMHSIQEVLFFPQMRPEPT